MSKRSYAQYCGLAKALDVVGERWTLLIVRNLLLGPLRYSDLLRGLHGITTNLLAKRLREMEAHGLVRRIRTAGGEAGHAYELTGDGRELEPVIHALGRWGFRRAGPARPDDRRDLEWLLVALRRRYRGGATLAAELLVDETPYHVVLTPGAVRTGRGSPPDPQVRLRGPGPALARLFLAGWPGDGVPDGVTVEGAVQRGRELVEAFERGDGLLPG